MRDTTLLIASFFWTGCQPSSSPIDTGFDEVHLCSVSFQHQPDPDLTLDGVSLIGDFNEWDVSQNPMTELEEGAWSTTLSLAPGSYAYRFSEEIQWTQKGFENRLCDPQAAYLHCENGTHGWPDEGAICQSGKESLCSSLLRVEDCSQPSLEFIQVIPSRTGLVAEIRWTPENTQGLPETWEISLNGEELTKSSPLQGSAEIVIEDDGVRIELEDLSPGHHLLHIRAEASSGADAELGHRFWTDSKDNWRQAPIYFAFVDRFSNGDSSLDFPEGASTQAGEFQGGDWAGIESSLPYLVDLGIQTLWLSNPQSNAPGAWSGDCGESYSAYHAYWPDSRTEVEEHFGNTTDLKSLVNAAHGVGIRVIMDWVGNHVHSEHPLYSSKEDEWFHPEAICEDSVSEQSNWSRIPETCWFAPYLPDLDYGQPEVMELMLDDAMWWVQTYGFDGLRVDAVKHMPHSVAWNLERRIQEEIELRSVGGTDSFWTLGETFDGRDQIAAYLSSSDRPQLDGQFDFPLYYALLDSIAWSNTSLADLEAAVQDSDEAYGEGIMANFLGNHDTGRFSTLAAGEGDRSCQDDTILLVAEPTPDSEAYARMRMAWTFLFTQTQAPLIYYGDELGIPGFGDPDNRQALWNHDLDLSGSPSLESAQQHLRGEAALMLAHVAALSQTRKSNPATWRGESTQWWLGPSEWPTTWAWSRIDDVSGTAVLVILNVSAHDVVLENSLSFAGLPSEGTYVDLLDGSTFEASSDWIQISVPAFSSRLLSAPSQ